MALTRRFLSALGIEAEKIDEIINAHAETVDALKAERDDFKDKAEAHDKIKDELDKANERITELEKDGGKDSVYKVKYDAIKEEYEEYKASIEAENTKASKTKAYKELLKEIGISEKRIDAVARVADFDKIELNKDGSIRKADELKETLSKEWEDFIEQERTEGADVTNPPKGSGGSTMTKDEIMKIQDAGQRQQAIAENHELFGF